MFMINKSAWPLLLQIAVCITLLPSAIIFLFRFISAYCHVQVPTWIVLIGAVIGPLVILETRKSWFLFRDRRAAAAAGAILPPVYRGRWPGSIDILLKVLNSFYNGYPGDFHSEAIEKLGNTYNIRILSNNLIFTTEPESIKAILATEFSIFEKGPVFYNTMSSVLGTGVFNSDGEMWKFHRAMTRPFFSRERISHFNIFDRHMEQTLNLMKSRLREGYAIDFQDIVARFTLDSASEFLFGHCVNSLSAGLLYPHDAMVPTTDVESDKSYSFTRAFAHAQDIIAIRALLGANWPLLEIFEDKSSESMKVVNAYLEPIIADVLRKAKDLHGQEKDDFDDDETLLDNLAKHTSDEVILRDETLNILIAGRDTTASTLTFAVYLFAMYPHVFARLRKDVLKHVGPTRRPTYDDVKELKYLRAVINETLRLFPAVPFNARTSVAATTFPSPVPGGRPFYVPKGTKCGYGVWHMHRRKDLWGEDADEFDPDRFIDDRLQKYLIPKPFIFLPFNAGPRICLGQQFAYNEMSFFLIRLLQNFDSITLAPDAQPPHSRVPEQWAHGKGRKAMDQIRSKSHLTLYAFGGMWVRMREAKTTEDFNA